MGTRITRALGVTMRTPRAVSKRRLGGRRRGTTQGGSNRV